MLYIYMLTVEHLSLGGRHGICWLMMFSGFNRITVCQNFRAQLWLANGHQAAVFAGVLTWPCQKHCSGHGWQPAMQVWIFRFSASRWFQNVPTHVSFPWALMVQNPEYAIMECYGVLRSSHQSFIKPNVGSHHGTILSSMAIIKSPPHHKNDYGDSRTIDSYCKLSNIYIWMCSPVFQHRTEKSQFPIPNTVLTSIYLPCDFSRFSSNVRSPEGGISSFFSLQA